MYNILVWGTGYKAEQLLKNNVKAKILGFIQTNKIIDGYAGYRVFSPDKIPFQFDYIFVANTYGDEIKSLCEAMGLDLNKVIFLCRGLSTNYRINDEIKEILGEVNSTNYVAEYEKIEDTFFDADRKL